MKSKTYLLSGLIALFLLFGLIAPQAAEARDIIINATPTLEFDPGTATATTCGTVDVNVLVNDVVNLTAYHLEVTYDRTKVQVTEVVNGGFLAAPGMVELYEPTNTVDDGTGRLLFGMAQQGTDGNPVPKSGSGNLITIRLKSLVVAGTTTLTIDGVNSMLVDWPEAQAIAYTVAGTETITLQSCAPTDIALGNAAVDENKPVGTVVGTLSATDPDAGDTVFSYLLVNPIGYPDNASFQIVGNELQTNAVFDNETKTSYQILVRVTGPHGLTYDEVFTITVNDVNDAPVLAAIGAKSVVNTGTLTFIASATDQDVPADTLTFSVKDAPAAATINPTTGAFSWTPTVDTDAGTYYATVCVSDGLLEDCEIVTITVTDGEAPTVVSGVAKGVAPYSDVVMVGTSFTVPQGFVVSTVQFTISEPVTIVGSNIVYMGTVPYGTMAVSGSVVTVTPYPGNEIAAQLGTFTFNVDAGSIEDLAGNPLASLSATLIVTDQTAPVIVSITAKGATGFGDVTAAGMTLSVERGYTVETIDIVMSEPVTVVTGTQVTLAGVPYGTVAVSSDGLTVTVTPFAGNEVAGLTGTFNFIVPDGAVKDIAGNAWVNAPVILVVTDTIAPVVTITGATADGVAMGGNLEDGYILPTTNDPAIDHLVQMSATTSEPLANEYFGLYFVPGESTLTAAELNAYYDARASLPEVYRTYLKAAVAGTNPVVFIRGSDVTLVDAAKHVLVPIDVPMTIPDDFPLGTITVRGIVKDAAGNETTVTLKLIVTGDRVAPVLTITGATADGTAMGGDLTNGYVLITNGVATVDRLVQFASGTVSSEPLADTYFGLKLINSTVSAADLKAYYLARGVPEPYLAYLNSAADGINPFAYIKGTTVTLVDAAKHDIGGTDVAMTIPDDFPVGTYTVQGVVRDAAGNETTVTLKLIVVRTLAVTDANLFFGTVSTVIDQALGGTFADGFTMVLDPMVPWYYLDTNAITSNNTLADGSYPFTLNGGPTDPVFYVKVVGTNYTLIDAYLLANGGTESPLRINGDFAPGTYTYTGSLTDIYGSTAPVSIEITFNDLPYATAQSVTVVEDTPTAITLSGVDLYPGTKNYVVVTSPAHGTLSGTAPALTYTPAADFHGTDSFTFTLSDGTLTSTAATVSITVTSVLDAPTVSSTNLPGPYMVGLDQAFQVTLTNPANGDAFTNVLARFRLEGITLADIASFQYLETSVDPDVWLPLPLVQDGTGVTGDFGPGTGFPMAAPYNATSQFKITFNTAGTYPATIVLYDVAADPDVELDRYEADAVVVADFEVTDVVLMRSVDQTAWFAVPGSFAAGFEMPLLPSQAYYYFDVSTLAATRPLADGSYPFYLTETPGAEFFAYWADKGVVDGATGWQGLMWQIINGDAPMFFLKVVGTDYSLIDGLQGAPNLLRINGDYFPGAYAFSGIVEDAYGFTDEVPVDIIFNDIPVANAQTVTTNEDTAVAITFSGVDLFPGSKTYAVVTSPAHGTLSGTAPALTYTPAADFHGSDSFTFTLSDGTLTSTAATVSITVTSVLDAPTVDSTNLPGPYMVGLEQAFQVTLTNPANGDAFTNVLARFRLEDITLADIASFKYLETSLEPDQWLPLPLVQDGTGVVGDFGPAAGFPMAAPYAATSQFKITFNTAGTYPATIVLFDVAADPDVELDRYEADADVFAEFKVTNADLKYATVAAGPYSPLAGSYAAGFVMELDPTVAWYYLDTDVITTNSTLADGLYPFYLAPDTATPIFYVKVEGTTYTLIDAYLLANGGGEQPLRINGDFVPGTYTYTGNLTDVNGFDAEASVKITFIDALAWLQANTVLSSVSGTIADLRATFPLIIPPVIVAEPYVIDSRMTLAATLPAGTTVTIYREGVPVLSGITLSGVGPFYFTELFDPDAPRAAFDAGYGGAVENYVITVTGPGTNPLDFDTTVFIESVISKDGFATETVLDDITLDIHIDDAVGPVVTIIGATADGAAMSGNLTDGYILPTTNDPAIDHLLQIDASVSEPLVPKYNGLYFVESESTVTAAQLKAYYDARNVPQPYLDFLKGAADGTNPFVFLKEAGLALSLVDAAKYTIQSQDVDMTVPDTFPLGKYVVRGVVADAEGNETTVTFILIVTGDRVAPAIGSGVAKSTANGDVNLVDGKFTVNQGYVVDTIEITMTEPVQVALGTIVTMEGYGPYGTVTANVGGVITITPYPINNIAALIGSFTFTVPAGSVTDLSGNPFTGSIGLEVLNVAPVALNDAYTTDEDVALTVSARGVLINDTDFDPSILTAVKLTDPANGTLTLNTDGSFTYTPALNFNGTDTFTYKANDGLADSNVATVTITVTSTNDIPVLGTIADASIPELVEFSFTATATDVDLPAQALTFSLVGAPEGAAITSAGVFTWTPSELQGPGVYTFTVKVCDDATPALCDEQEVTLTVTEVNVAPVANDLTVTTPEDTPLDITLVATDVDGNALTYVIVAQPTHGTVTLVGNVATYTPALDFNGTDTFNYKANDGTTDSNVATVTITVTPLNDTPIAVDDFYTMDEDTTLTIAVPGVMLNDSDVDLDIMEVVLVTDVQNGKLSLFGNGSFVYVPDPDYFGTDTFVYRLVTYPGPQSAWIDEAIVTITVNPINDAPVLGLIPNATIPELVPFTFTAMATDVDLPAQVLTFSLVGAPEGAAITAGGIFTWTPTESQGAGVYTFTVKVCDAATPALCDEQAVTLTVTEVNVAPVAANQTVTTPEETAVDVTLVATDADGNTLTYSIIAQPAHGSVTLAGAVATYTPDPDYFGPDSFTFKANDGLVDSNVATVTITVTNINDAPVAVDDDYTVAEKATLTVAAPGVLDNDIDVDGDPLSAILVDGVLHGTLTLNADGSFIYTPNDYFNGTDSFTYKAKDAALESDLAVVTITVTPVNDWPIANDDFYEVLTGNDLVKDAAEGVLANDVLLDPDEVVSIQILEGPQHGQLGMNDDGSFTYTPNAGYMGTDTFRYMVLSVRAINGEWSDDALVTITVKPYMGLFLPIIWR